MKPRKDESDHKFLERVMRGLLKHFANTVIVTADDDGTMIVVAGGDGNESQERFTGIAARVLQRWSDEKANKITEHDERLMQIIHEMVARGPQKERN